MARTRARKRAMARSREEEDGDDVEWGARGNNGRWGGVRRRREASENCTSSRSHLLGLEVAVLPLLGLGVLVGHLLAEPAVVGLADLSPHLRREEG